ncbi:MAG TPA: hypothetical protein PKG54_02675 [Phycisphaerae bacterium]|nr:hypothetical protein [Phycisphaerae bacterium]HOB73407.1 hypothetical protein [Phycisphaerae bacterium]HOJ54941.1 hypothetical protein [Phycisphaerae bacterium]HOL25049.1 hypothetical protein [Phycisphaerae bacterium]HPP21350.1 hypothetical protein [Phycisphaerae bacterium]
MNGFHKRIVIGVEIEAYSIGAADYQIGRRLSRPRPGVSENGERFARDTSIGSEYNSRPFETVRESLFLLKSGLRKYLRNLYGQQHGEPDHNIPLLVGGWTNRFAGAHLHLSVANEELTRPRARSLAAHLHDNIPLLIAMGANSPVWDKKITAKASNRLLRGTDTYFEALKRGELTSKDTREMVYSPGRKRKPATLELRVLDSNIPEFIVAAVCVTKAVALGWLRRKGAPNPIHNQEDYIQARFDAGTRGMKCRLPWDGEWIPARKYLDRFLWEYRDEFEEMDVPSEVYDIFKLLKRGYNGAKIIHNAALIARQEHPQTWQRRFAKRYSIGLEDLLSGNSLEYFTDALKVKLPNIDSVYLGRKGASVDA